MGQKEQASSPVNLRALALIRDQFAASGMTQDQLAAACGMPRSTLANVLSSTAPPRLIHAEHLFRIAVALGADVDQWAAELEQMVRSLKLAHHAGVAIGDASTRSSTRGRRP